MPTKKSNDYKIGKSGPRIYLDGASQSTPWRVDFRRKTIQKKDQRRRFATQIEAEDWAHELVAIDAAQNSKTINLANPAYQETIENIEKRVHYINEMFGHGDVTFQKVFEIGYDTLWKCIEHQYMFADKDGNIPPLNDLPLLLFQAAKENLEAKVRVADLPNVHALIDEFIAEKSSPVANKKRREPISKVTLDQWKGYIQKFLKTVYPTDDIPCPTDDRSEFVAKFIDAAVSSAGRNKGKRWSQQTKKNCAEKVCQFGAWVLEKHPDKISVNPWGKLNTFYALDDNREVSVLTNDQIRVLFKTLCSQPKFKKLIPYFSLLIFAGLRPSSEVFSPRETKRKFQWYQMQGWSKKSKRGGLLIDIPKIRKDGSKATKLRSARKAELIEPGIAWMKHAFKELPQKGQIEVTQSLLRDFKAALPFELEQDVCRHTFSSNAIAFTDDGAYWHERCGHTATVQKTHYSNPPNHEEAKEFFGLTPKAVLEKHKEI